MRIRSPIVVLAIVSNAAGAWGQTADELATPATPATPAPRAAFPPPGYTPPNGAAFPLARGPVVPLGADEAHQAPAPPARPVPWERSTALGLALGLGAPYGYAGVFVAHSPTRWSQLEVGAGYSAPFGPAAGFMTRAGLDPGNGTILSIGAGISTNFTNYDYQTNCTYVRRSSSSPPRETCTPPSTRRPARGTANPLWLNLELADDLRFPSGFGTRLALGASVLLNTADFPAALGCPDTSAGRVPCNVGVATQEQRTYWEVYLRLDLYLLVHRGSDGGTNP